MIKVAAVVLPIAKQLSVPEAEKEEQWRKRFDSETWPGDPLDHFSPYTYS